jgi:hypothetical protein
MLKVSYYIQESGLCHTLTVSSETKVAVEYLKSHKLPNTGQSLAELIQARGKARIAQAVWRLTTSWKVWESNPVAVRFSAPIQTSPPVPPSYAMGTKSLLGVKWPGHGIDHPPPSSTAVTERVELYLYSPSGPSWPVLG